MASQSSLPDVPEAPDVRGVAAQLVPLSSHGNRGCANDLESNNDGLDFEPYHDNPDDEPDHPDEVLPTAQETNTPPAQISPARPFHQEGNRTVVPVFVVVAFLFIGAQAYAIWSNFPPIPQPIPGPRPSPNQNYSLNFPEVYPKVDVQRSTPQCRATWETLTGIPCHEAIWERGWDSGSASSPPIETLLPLICDPTRPCGAHLRYAKLRIEQTCVGENVFDLDGYSGRFNTTLLERNVLDVVDVLSERYQRTCRSSPLNDAVGGYCMMDLEARFGIVDGIRSDGLEGLDSFLARTNHNSSRNRELVTCSWCTITWLKEKLSRWDEKMGGNDSMILPEYLSKWRQAGSRCSGPYFDDAYYSAIKSYVKRQLLGNEWLRDPSNEIGDLIRNGASATNYPVPEIRNLYSILMSYIQKTVDDGPDVHNRLIYAEEYISCLDAIQLGAQSIDSYPFLSWQNITTHILRDIPTSIIACSAERARSVEDLRKNLTSACPRYRNGYNEYDDELAMLFLPFSISPILKYLGTIHLYEWELCASAENKYSIDAMRGGIPCPAIFAQWGMQDWAFSRCGENMQEIIRVTRRELLKLPEMPSKLRDFKHPNRTLTDEERATEIEKTDWVWNATNGVCSDCIWRRFVHKWGQWACLSEYGHTRELAMEWLLTAHLLQDECLKVGKEFPRNELQQPDNNWKKLYGQVAWDEAFREGRKGPSWLDD